VPPFSGPNAIHERLRAKRLARVQQMRRDAEVRGDAQGAQRAQYLEGMVNQLHKKGLFVFGQEVMSAIQQGQLNGSSILGGGSSSSPSGSSTELPEADLGTPGALPEADLGAPGALPDAQLGEPGALPESSLGEPVPIPADGSSTAPDAPTQTEVVPELPPPSP
jgi:hypothetical protein